MKAIKGFWFVGVFLIGFTAGVILVSVEPLRSIREKNLISRSIEEGARGRFRIVIDSVHYHLEADSLQGGVK